MKNGDFTWVRAEKDLFAVYQTVYSEADIEMWYSWSDRLKDTKWSDDCYFLCREGEKVGGAIIADGLVMFAFRVPPFCDRYVFWKLVLDKAEEVTKKEEIVLRGVLAGEVPVLQNHGARIWRARQMMCRPTDVMPYDMPEDFLMETPSEDDCAEIAAVQQRSFHGGIAAELFGEEDLEENIKSVRTAYMRYAESNTLDLFSVARHKRDNKIVGACIAGINPDMPNRFAGIDEVFVLPAYRGRGLAEAMMKRAIAMAYPKTPVVKLHVLSENRAASLYHRLGFVSGPSFTDMKYKPARDILS